MFRRSFLKLIAPIFVGATASTARAAKVNDGWETVMVPDDHSRILKYRLNVGDDTLFLQLDKTCPLPSDSPGVRDSLNKSQWRLSLVNRRLGSVCCFVMIPVAADGQAKREAEKIARKWGIVTTYEV